MIRVLALAFAVPFLAALGAALGWGCSFLLVIAGNKLLVTVGL